MTTKIDTLTPEQEALIPVYREKWRAIALSTERIDRQKAKKAVEIAYQIISSKKPNVIFLESPYAALRTITSKLGKGVARSLGRQIFSHLRAEAASINLTNQLWANLGHELGNALWHQVGNRSRNLLWNHFYNSVPKPLRRELDDICIPIGDWICFGSFFEYLLSVFYPNFNQEKWLAFEMLTSSCGWIFPYEEFCLVCDRPTKLSFDSQNRLHAEGEPAIQFTDGFSVYAYHGAKLPDKYSKTHPQKWKSKWLLEEPNAELRRVLIQAIGYSRICQELLAFELDSWQSYTLLQILDDIDVEPIHLLKMICPSTGFIHVVRVPPEMTSAREAIRWVNWDIDPEEFSTQT